MKTIINGLRCRNEEVFDLVVDAGAARAHLPALGLWAVCPWKVGSSNPNEGTELVE